jgi:DNA-binding NarL/FixJ family response regulator
MDRNSNSRKIKIVIADDFLLLRTAWPLLLHTNPNFEVVGTTPDGRATVDFIKAYKDVDVILMDINMPVLNGIEATVEIDNIAPWIKVIGLSMYSEFHYANKMLKAGAKGFVTKSADKDELFRAIIDVYNNIPYISPSISKTFHERLNENGEIKTKNDLSSREIDIIKGIINGQTSKEIAEELSISSKTVDVHKTNIFKKLNVHNTASMTKKVMEEGILIIWRKEY